MLEIPVLYLGSAPSVTKSGDSLSLPAGEDVVVRPMRLDEVHFRGDYFTESSDEHLSVLGVDRSLLLPRNLWMRRYEQDFERPLSHREEYPLAWDLRGDLIGFSTAERIEFGVEAFMHLHIVDPQFRRLGYGSVLVRKSAELYFVDLGLQRLFSEPNAFNVASNRTLQRAGFRYQFSHEAAPTPINRLQITTRWALDRPTHLAPG